MERPQPTIPGRATVQGRSPAPVFSEISGARLLISDARAGFILLNEARYEAFERLLGADRSQANLMSGVLVLTCAEAVRGRWEKMMSGPPLPSAGDTVLGVAAGRTLLQEVAGASSRDTPLFAGLLTLAIVGGAARPTLNRSARGLRTMSHQARVTFHHRYGHLVGRIRPR